MDSRTLTLSTVVILLLSDLPGAVAQPERAAYQPRTVLNRALPAITNAPIVSVKEAQVADNELVIGVVVAGQARAYPINQLTGPRREIINDQLAGTAIAATW